MAGTTILSQAVFTDADSFILRLAAQLQGILVSSDVPVERGETWMVFEPAPAASCSRVVFMHWNGRPFPVTCGAEDINRAPKATLAVVLEDNIFAADEELMDAVRTALGDDLTQRYTEP